MDPTKNMTLAETNTARRIITPSEQVTTTPTPAAAPRLSLGKLAAEIRAIDKENHVGPLKSALRLIALDNDWETYRSEAGGVSFEDWAATAFGNKQQAALVRRRVDAINKCKALGYPHTFATGTFRYDTLVYLMGRSIPDKKRIDMVRLATEEQKARKNILPMTIIRSLVVDALGKQSKKHQRAAALEAALAHIRACHGADTANILPAVPKILASLI